VSLGNGFGLFHKLLASHIGWAVTWQIADDGSRVDACVNFRHFWCLWYDWFADTAASGINHGWNVILATGFFTSDC
jgi:hypothetical protein